MYRVGKEHLPPKTQNRRLMQSVCRSVLMEERERVDTLFAVCTCTVESSQNWRGPWPLTHEIWALSASATWLFKLSLLASIFMWNVIQILTYLNPCKIFGPWELSDMMSPGESVLGAHCVFLIITFWLPFLQKQMWRACVHDKTHSALVVGMEVLHAGLHLSLSSLISNPERQWVPGSNSYYQKSLRQ